MRKLISILVVLGLVLSMAVMATPVAAKVAAGLNPVVPVTNCAFELATYTLNFTVTAALHPGSNHIFVEFPEGTVVPTTGWTSPGRIEVSINNGGDWDDVFVGEIFVTGQVVKFMVPIIIPDGAQVLVRFNSTATFGIRNPGPGRYRIYVWTDRPADETPVALPTPPALGYRIVPAISSYKFTVDFAKTYPGIAVDFIPPFKACGQNSSDDTPWKSWNFTADKWANNFTLTFAPFPAGCAAPCANATVWFTVPEVVPDSLTHFWVNDELFPLEPLPGDAAILDAWGDLVEHDLTNIDPLLATTAVTYNLSLHFDTPGDYEICFYVFCPDQVCEEGGLIAEICMPFTVHQWKDAYPIPINAKWNLISLPLVPFDTSIESILAPMDLLGLSRLVGPGFGQYLLQSVWHYDRCGDEWFAYGNGQTSLTDIEDGKAYWFRAFYGYHPVLGFTIPSGTPLGVLWVFGTARPMAPAAPPAYPVCEGWNMVGFLPPWTGLPALPQEQANEAYLWNFFSFLGQPEYGFIYGWNAATQTWDTAIQPTTTLPTGGNLVPTKGYWIGFSRDGFISP